MSNQQEITPDTVKNHFISLFESQDKHVTERANKFLLDLQLTPQAWTIAQDLITNPQNSQQQFNQIHLQQIQFLGCQVLYHKTKSEFAQLDLNHLNELRQFIFNILSNNTLNLNTASQRQLCSCIGVIGLYGLTHTWTTMLDDIIQFMQQGQKNISLGLEILEGFAKDIDVIIIDQMTLSQIKRLARQNSSKLFEIFNSLINTNNTDEAVLLKAIECLVQWTNQGLRLQCFEDPSLIKNIGFVLLQKIQDEEISSKIADFFEELFSNADNKNLRVLQSLDPEAQYSQNEKQNHQVIIELLVQMRSDFQQCMNNRELNPEFCKLYSDILVSFCHYNDVHLLENQQVAVQLLEMLIETVKHKSLKISLISLEFWCTLRKTLEKFFQEPQYTYLVEAYKELLKSVLFQARYRKTEHKKHEQDEKFFYEDVKLSDYRKVVADIILQCLMALKAQNKEQGIQYFQEIIFQLFSTKSEDPDYLLNLEVSIFACASVFDDDVFFDTHTDFMDKVFTFVLSDQVPSDYFLVSETLQFIFEGCLHVKNSAPLLDGVIKYIVKNIQVEENRSQAATTFVSIADAINSHNLLDTLQMIIPLFVQQLDQFDSETVIENLVTSMFTMALKLEQDEHKKQAVTTLFNIVEQKITTFQANPNPTQQQFTNLLNILNSVFKGFDVYQQQTMELIQGCIKGFFDTNFTFIIQFYQKYGEVEPKKFVTLLISIIKRTKSFIPDSFTLFLNHSLALFQQKPTKNYDCLQVLYNLFEYLKQQNNQVFNTWLQQQFFNFNDFMIQQISQNQDCDVIKEWIKILKKSAEYSAELLVSQPNFEQLILTVIQVLKTILNYELSRELLFFLIVFLKSPNLNVNPKCQKLVPEIVAGMFHVLPDLSMTLLYQYALVLTTICQNHIQNKDQIANIIYQQLQIDTYNSPISQENVQMYDEYKQLLSTGIITLSIQGMHKVKLTLSDLHQVVNRQINFKDALVALKFKLGHEKQIVL